MISINFVCYKRSTDLVNALVSLLISTDLENLHKLFKVRVLMQKTTLNKNSIKLLKGLYAGYDFKIQKINTNLGVAGGRNYLLQKYSIERYNVFFDDDIIFDGFSFEQALRASEEFDLLNLQVYSSEGVLRTFEIPRPKARTHATTIGEVNSFHINYLIGAACVISRQTLQKIGNFDIELGGYGMEEIEFSLRAISSGFSIGNHVQPQKLRHIRSPLGRISRRDITRQLAHRRLKITRSYLSNSNYLKFNFKWMFYLLLRGEFNWFPRRLKRKVNKNQIILLNQYLKKTKAWL